MKYCPNVERLSRLELDRVARAVVSGRRGYGRRIDGLADRIAGLMTNRLRALGAGGDLSLPSGRRGLAADSNDRKIFEHVIRRVEKHLGQVVLREMADRGSPAR